ncbi:MAG: PAS domain-containing protein [Caldilinea sp. CFX5]|nr:PAS domain-containing protein [Caldilinea sp. CFX5]
MEALKDLLLTNERWLMQRVLHYAKVHNYVKYTSTLLEAWRISVESLSLALVTALARDERIPELDPDDAYSQDPIAAFGVEEGRKHRARGLTLTMYMSLFKYYRQSYIDLIEQAPLTAAQSRHYGTFVNRCFDRIELGMISVWTSPDEEARFQELQRANRHLANEKNKYLTIFESLHAPVILLDRCGAVTNMNHAAAALFTAAQHPGDIYYGEVPDTPTLDWLTPSLRQLAQGNQDKLEFEQTLATNIGPRYYQVKVERMLDVSERYLGNVVLLNDLTERKQTERALHHRTQELSTLYDVTALAGAPAPLERMLADVLARVLRTVQCQGGDIHLLDPASGELRLVARSDAGSQYGKNFATPNTSALAAWVVAHDETLVISEMGADQRVPPAIRTDHTYVGAPMGASKRPQGVLSLYRAAGQPFAVSEVSLLASVAEGVGLAVENSWRSRQAAVLQERERLARELHDSVTQSLYSLTLFSEWTAGLLHNGDYSEADAKLERIGAIARQALKEMRLMLYELRSAELQKEGLRSALETRLAAVEERAGVETALNVDHTLKLPETVEAELYHIAGEALNNALKHAAAHRMTVQLQRDGPLVRFCIADDGVGFDYSTACQSGGMGLQTMRTRAERIGGQLLIEAAPGQGSRINVLLKLDDKE